MPNATERPVNFSNGAFSVKPAAAQMPSRREKAALPGVVGLACLLVAGLWVFQYFRPEARVLRATDRILRLVQKPGEESPVALGLAANRLGGYLATNAVLQAGDYGIGMSGRQEIVQLFAQVRASLERMTFAQPRRTAATPRRGEVAVLVKARYRLEALGGEQAEGDGTADLQWRKTQEGWKIVRAVVRTEEAAGIPGAWP
jgi:ketosteroid isomerase-like protein